MDKKKMKKHEAKSRKFLKEIKKDKQKIRRMEINDKRNALIEKKLNRIAKLEEKKINKLEEQKDRAIEKLKQKKMAALENAIYKIK